MIMKLKNKLNKISDDEEKKKLKTSNTTLRGEKTILMNQLNSTKRLLTEKSDICETQSIEIHKLKL